MLNCGKPVVCYICIIKVLNGGPAGYHYEELFVRKGLMAGFMYNAGYKEMTVYATDVRYNGIII